MQPMKKWTTSELTLLLTALGVVLDHYSKLRMLQSWTHTPILINSLAVLLSVRFLLDLARPSLEHLSKKYRDWKRIKERFGILWKYGMNQANTMHVFPHCLKHRIKLEYNSDLFSKETIARYGKYLTNIIAGISRR